MLARQRIETLEAEAAELANQRDDTTGEELIKLETELEETNTELVTVIEAALDDYKADLESFDARIQMRLSFPMEMESLRSGLSGWQYYDIALELVETAGVRRKIVHLDFVYSSTCPCSLELSEHARQVRGQLATPHELRRVRRDIARLRTVLNEKKGEAS